MTKDPPKIAEQRLPRLLVVDDEPLNIRAISRFLRGLAEVDAADSGMEALTHLALRPYDAILLEVSVPGPDGGCFGDFLKEDPPPWMAKVILTYAGREDLLAQRLALKHGCALLPKPFNPQELWQLMLARRERGSWRQNEKRGGA
jgi:CheY-like chemotaxis protein